MIGTIVKEEHAANELMQGHAAVEDTRTTQHHKSKNTIIINVV